MTWISVKDRLPANDDNVLAIVTGTGKNITFVDSFQLCSFWEGEGWDVEGYPDADIDVSFWMPLPDSPSDPPETLSLRQRYPCYITEDQRLFLIEVLKLSMDVYSGERRSECVQLLAEFENLPSPKR